MIFSFLIISLVLNFNLYNKVEKERWLVEESSQLLIEGSSNVNEFTCKIQSRTRKDTLTIAYDERSNRIDFVKNEVYIDTRAFDCQNAMITSDLKKTLKTDKHPYITLHFLTLQKPTFQNFSSQRVRGTIAIEIAGNTEKYAISYHMTPKTDGTILLEGKQIVNIKDFNLSTPQKLMGLIKVNEQIQVDFTMKLSPLL
ncbi:MAG: hypothetical protein ACNS60_02170 [Candidatus Cyclobacteriaceae bacterium M2_1C_046]